MASEAEMTEYERRRLENIKRNGEMMASLSIYSHLSDLSASSKRLRGEKRKWQKKPSPAVIRRSLRAQGMSPHFDGLSYNHTESLAPSKFEPKTRKTLSNAGPVSMRDAYNGEGSHWTLVDKFTCLAANKSPPLNDAGITGVERIKAEKSIDFNSFKLESRNVARVVSDDIFVVRFLPTHEMVMVVVGNRKGELVFWDVRQQNEEDKLIHRYQPHSAAISGISVHPFTLSKVYTSSYEGFLRSMNIEREEFDLVYSSTTGSDLYCVSQQPNCANSIYFGEGAGGLTIFDERIRKIVNSWSLHEERINSIDFSSANSKIIATGSTDGLACLWDLRKMDVKYGRYKTLQTVKLGRTVLSAYFSPSGNCLAMSSLNGDINVLSGANFEDLSRIRQGICTNRWSSSPRTVWGWDDEHLFAGDMKRNINVLSVTQRRVVHTLEDLLMSNISSRYDAHPCTVGMLAAATFGGHVYIWTTSL